MIHYDVLDIPQIVNPKVKIRGYDRKIFIIYKQLSSDLCKSAALLLKLFI